MKQNLIDFYPDLLIETPIKVKPSEESRPDIDAVMKQLKDIAERNKEEK
ncbi:hypothetical protein LCGC14_1564620 [marine sediment metagenome]|uniref:Uncharacterized protein n=1 Tax=marine sediment metagenome TaxID=412755 RepID=A0A0F9J7M0_9ZZZZ